MRRGGKRVGCSAWKRPGSGTSYQSDCQRDKEAEARLVSVASRDKTRGAQIEIGKIPLEHKKKPFFTVGVAEHWNELPGLRSGR